MVFFPYILDRIIRIWRWEMSPFGPWPEQWYLMSQIGPLQLAIHVVQNRRAGEKKSHWEKANKENY